MYDAAIAVKQVHDKEICHNDIKPENFMMLSKTQPLLRSPPYLKLIDFGHARFSSSLPDVHGEGSLNYMSNELIEKYILGKDQYVDCFKSDIWALGVTFYLITTLEMAFPTHQGMDTLTDAILQGRFDDDHAVLYENEGIHQLLMEMMNTAADERPSIDRVLRWFSII